MITTRRALEVLLNGGDSKAEVFEAKERIEKILNLYGFEFSGDDDESAAPVGMTGLPEIFDGILCGGLDGRA